MIDPKLAEIVAEMREQAIECRKDNAENSQSEVTFEINAALEATLTYYANRIEQAAAAEAGGGVDLSQLLAWVGQVYPATSPHGGAIVSMTWDEFNAMREAIGLKPLKPSKHKSEIVRLSAPPAPPAGGGWVSVSDRLPGMQVMVLLHCAGGSHAGAVVYGFYGVTVESPTARPDFYMMHAGGRYYPVREAGAPATHWQPLPAAPAQGDV